MPTTFTTDGLPLDHRVEYWRDLVGRFFARIDLNCRPDDTFRRKTTVWEMGALRFTTYGADGGTAHRRRCHIALDGEETFCLLLVRNGRLHLRQLGRESVVQAGHLCLLDANEPYDFQQPEHLDMLTLRIPGDMLRLRLGEPADYCPTSVSTAHGTGRIASDLLHAILREGVSLTQAEATHLAEHVSDIVALSLLAGDGGGASSESASRRALYHRMTQHVASRLGEPDLSPQDVAVGTGVSVRYLHRVFQDTGQSFSEYLRTQRLARSLEQLRNPLLRHRPVTGIAYDNGFTSATHFTTAFRRRYGTTPTEARRAARGGTG